MVLNWDGVDILRFCRFLEVPSWPNPAKPIRNKDNNPIIRFTLSFRISRRGLNSIRPTHVIKKNLVSNPINPISLLREAPTLSHGNNRNPSHRNPSCGKKMRSSIEFPAEDPNPKKDPSKGQIRLMRQRWKNRNRNPSLYLASTEREKSRSMNRIRTRQRLQTFDLEGLKVIK